MRLGALRRQLHRLLAVRHGAGVFAFRGVGVAALAVRLGIARVQGDVLRQKNGDLVPLFMLKGVLGLLPYLLRALRRRAVLPRGGRLALIGQRSILRLQLQRLVVIRHGEIVLAFFGIGPAALAVGLGIIRIHGDKLAQQRDGLVPLSALDGLQGPLPQTFAGQVQRAGLPPGGALVVAHRGVILRLQLQRPVIIRYGQLMLALLGVSAAALAVRLGMIRVHGDEFRQQGDGRIPLLAADGLQGLLPQPAGSAGGHGALFPGGRLAVAPLVAHWRILLRLQFQRLVVVGDGLHMLALLGVSAAAHTVCLGMVRLQGDKLGQQGDGLLPLFAAHGILGLLPQFLGRLLWHD